VVKNQVVNSCREELFILMAEESLQRDLRGMCDMIRAIFKKMSQATWRRDWRRMKTEAEKPIGWLETAPQAWKSAAGTGSMRIDFQTRGRIDRIPKWVGGGAKEEWG
jgi:hypothetical protein